VVFTSKKVYQMDFGERKSPDRGFANFLVLAGDKGDEIPELFMIETDRHSP